MIKKQEQAKQQAPLQAAQRKEEEYYILPTSSAANLILDVLEAGEKIDKLPDRKKQINHTQIYEVANITGTTRKSITLENNRSTITIELSDIDRQTGNNKAAKKLFVLSLIKLNEQAIHNGQLTRDYISFPLQELIDKGFYTTPQSARVGFDNGMLALEKISMKGQTQYGQKIVKCCDATGDRTRVLFTGSDLEKGQCIIYFNSHINWGFIAEFFTILPKYYWDISDLAKSLLLHIFIIARQNGRNIEEKGYFTISLRTLQVSLNLPSESKNRKPKETIKQPIEKAVKEINTKHSKTYGNTELALSLQPDNCNELSIKEYLSKGYLQVSLSGSFADYFIAISQRTAEKIEEAQKKQARIEEAAAARKLSKK